MGEKQEPSGFAQCPLGIEAEVAMLRREIDEKHTQNRKDIHAIRNEQQMIRNDSFQAALKFARLEAKIMPLVGEHGPGLVAEISKRLDDVAKMLTDVQIKQGIEKGERTVQEWVADGFKALIIGLMLALVAHFWK